MEQINVTLSVSEAIIKGISEGIYTRIGGLIYENATKLVFGFLRELSGVKTIPSELLTLIGEGHGIGALNLGLSTMGFVILLRRVNALETQLQNAQQILQKIDYKLDLSFYANFRAALDLAVNAFTMKNPDIRKTTVLNAIDRLAEATFHYAALTKMHLEAGTQIVDMQIATLLLAYTAAVRCYLELEEIDTAMWFLNRGEAELIPLTEQYIRTLLANPAFYLHPKLKGKVDLEQLTMVLQWLEPDLNENAVFEQQRENFVSLIEKPQKSIEALPSEVWNPQINTINIAEKARQGRFYLKLPSIRSDIPDELFERLHTLMGSMGKIIEDSHRFQAYRTEIHTIQQLEITFKEWLNASPSDIDENQDLELFLIELNTPVYILSGDN